MTDTKKTPEPMDPGPILVPPATLQSPGGPQGSPAAFSAPGACCKQSRSAHAERVLRRERGLGASAEYVNLTERNTR